VLGNFLLALSIQIGPFYEQRDDFVALRPFWSKEEEKTDVLWPVYTSHRDWWRFCWAVHSQWSDDGESQFSVIPLWASGTGRDGSSYAGLFPVYGSHPHFLMMYDWRYCMWPVWMSYRKKRPSTGEWLETDAVLFPFFHWRSDGSWGAWPIYGYGRQRESDHRYILWPLVTWASYREDRDTAGEGISWMVWPLLGRVHRSREKQHLFLPPFFSWAEADSSRTGLSDRNTPDTRLRCPWPFFEQESSVRRKRVSVFPFYERVTDFSRTSREIENSVTRFGWRLVELYPSETRVFPFWKSGKDHFRFWPFYETYSKGGVSKSRALALCPVTWVDSIDRNWAKFWTFYERERSGASSKHSLLWGLIEWRTSDD
jgi:hypothetical protein